MKKIVCCIILLAVLAVTACKSDSQVNISDTIIENDNVFAIDGELPEIGEFSGKDSQKRLYEEYTYDFIPSDSYGVLIPYADGLKDFDVLTKLSYGLCTTEGRIVMDASYDNEYVGYNKTDDGFEYYTVTKKNSNAVDEFEPTRSLFIPVSGQWYLDFEPYTYSSFIGNGVVVVSKNDVNYDNTEYFFYDYDGNELLHLTGYDYIGAVSNGLFYAALYDEGQFYYLNLKGERVLGPYVQAVDFNKDGVAPVKINADGGYCLIDTSGKSLTDTDYRSCRSDVSDDGETEVFIMEHQSNRNIKHIYDSKGNFLGEVISSAYISLKFPDNGEIYYYYAREYPDMVWKKLSDHSDFVSNEYEFFPNSYLSKDDAYLYVDEETNVGHIFDGNGDTVAVIDNYYGESFDISDSGKYITYITGEYEYDYNEITAQTNIQDSRQFNLYDTETDELLYTFDRYGFARFVGEDERYVIVNCYEDVDLFSSIQTTALYDTKNRCVVFENCEGILHFSVARKDYFIVYTQNSCILYDSEMNAIRKHYYE